MKIVTTSCSYNCGGRCILKVQVEGGRITRISTEDGPVPGLKACPRGLAKKAVFYAEDRLTRPLKRTGDRGSGKYEPIAWDEALETIACELRRVKDAFGNPAIFLMDYYGSMSPLHGVMKAAKRFFSLFGGCTTWQGNSSQEAALFSSLSTFGTTFTGSTRNNFLHSRLIVLWGWNPSVTRFGSETNYYLAKAKKAGTKIITVDPRYTVSARAYADQWIPIRPATDTALLIAMANVMIEENIYDRRFIETYAVGFEQFKDYVMGKEDGIPKTPSWAEGITGVPVLTIQQLARDYATIKPAALYASWAPGRTAFGEQYHRAASVLAAMTGNIGIPGGYAAGGSGRIPSSILGKTLPVPGGHMPQVHITKFFDALLKGKSGGYLSDVKLLYLVGSNVLNQFLNTNKGVEALKKPEFIVAHELFLTPTARYADIILPVTTDLECNDIGQPWLVGEYFIYMSQCIEPLPWTKSDLAIFTELASRLNMLEFNNRTDEDWLREFVAATPQLPDYEIFKQQGIHTTPVERPWVAFREQIEDHDHHPFPTPSGKIEICSPKIEEMQNPLIPPIPKYIEAWEGPADPLRSRYPLQLVTPHSRARANSTLASIPRLQKIAHDELWLNPDDAKARGISPNDKVRVYNERGQLISTARVTDQIMKGVVSLDSGAWYKPDLQGLDCGGCVNVLTRDEASPAGAFPCNSCLVEVKRAAVK